MVIPNPKPVITMFVMALALLVSGDILESMNIPRARIASPIIPWSR
jgi:hypothetical protein